MNLSATFSKIWILAEIILFVLVGAQVNINLAISAGLAGLIIIAVGLIARSVGVYISLLGTELTKAEKIFSMVAYTPKATVQAAMGAVPLAAGVCIWRYYISSFCTGHNIYSSIGCAGCENGR